MSITHQIGALLPRIIDPLMMAPLPASLNYSSSQKSEAIKGLIRDITSNLTGNLSSYAKYVTTELVADSKIEEPDQNNELSKGILTAGGPDGFGGNFAFCLFYFPALNALSLHTTLAIQQVLGTALAAIDEKGLEPDVAESAMNDAQEVCQVRVSMCPLMCPQTTRATFAVALSRSKLWLLR